MMELWQIGMAEAYFGLKFWTKNLELEFGLKFRMLENQNKLK